MRQIRTAEAASLISKVCKCYASTYTRSLCTFTYASQTNAPRFEKSRLGFFDQSIIIIIIIIIIISHLCEGYLQLYTRNKLLLLLLATFVKDTYNYIPETNYYYYY